MKIALRRSITQCSLVLEEDSSDLTDEFALKMISKNEIDGFLRPQIQEIDGKRLLVYDTGSEYSMNGIFELKKMTAEDMKTFLKSLSASLLSMEEYLLDTDMLILDPEFIFSENSEAGYHFCISPFSKDQQSQMQALADMIISCIDYEDQELVQNAYKLNMALNANTLSLSSIASIIEEKTDRSDDNVQVKKAFEGKKLPPVFQNEGHSFREDTRYYAEDARYAKNGTTNAESIRENNKKGILTRLRKYIDEVL